MSSLTSGMITIYCTVDCLVKSRSGVSVKCSFMPCYVVINMRIILSFIEYNNEASQWETLL